MKTIEEIYQALLDGKEVVNKYGDVINLEKSKCVDFSCPEGWRIYDKLGDLKKAFDEGAIIEFYDDLNEEWISINDEPFCGKKCRYRIKDGISIESWEAHKELIKAWWDGAIIEFYWNSDESWATILEPCWDYYSKYHIKGDISIKRWEVHKELIKAYWEGAEIEFYSNIEKDWVFIDGEPYWYSDYKYRVKPSDKGNETIKVGFFRPKEVSKFNNYLFDNAIRIICDNIEESNIGKVGVSAFIDWLEENYEITPRKK